MKRFGAYEILHELKSGGMGSVLLARRRGPGAFEQLVAIKTIRAEHAGTPAVRAMFLDEAAILARLNHPGIAHVHDFGEEAGSLYMVMEYVAGIPFRELVEHRPPPTVLARAIVEACRGLHAAHELRDLTGHRLDLVHRDISPDNLMLGFDGHVKVIDFGIALVKKNRQAPVTEFGSVKGKPPYMSPEQVANEPMDRRSDVFSLAVVLWELLTQKSLFEGDSIYAIAFAVGNQAIVPPSQAIGQPLPYGLDAAIMNALDRDLSRRTPTAAAFAEQLEQVIQHAGGESLEAWAERVLDGACVQHRAWLADVIGGSELPKSIGRATGQVTELAPLGQAKTPVAAAPPLVPETHDAKEPTSIGGTLDGLSVPPRSRLAPLVILLLSLLAAGIAVYLFVTKRTAVVVTHDAQIDATPIDDPPPVPTHDAPVADALADASEPIDALIDAGTRTVTIRSDAGRPAPKDAAVVLVKPDAAVVQPSGSGFVIIKFKQGIYANITIDDGAAFPGPVLKPRKIAAGRHTIKFLHPQSGEVLDTQTVTIEDGETVEVRQQ
ncbi:MAG TPA: protein kinase [Kofleriaceae bacterium]